MSNEIKIKIESTSPVADPVNLKTVKYDNLTGKPKINGVELVGDKSTADLKIDVDTSKFATKEDLAKIATFSISVVDALPETGEEKVLYFVPKDGEQPDIHDEYVWTNGAFELIGTTQVDLTGYVKNTDYANETTGGAIKTARTSFGVAVDSSGFLYASVRTKEQYASGITNMFIAKGTLENIKYDYVKRAITTNDIALTDEEKAAARSWISAVGNTDYATSSVGGVVKSGSGFGVSSGSGLATCFTYTQAQYTSNIGNGYFISKGTLENIKYDLVKRAITTNDITLTNEEKAAVQAWLGIDMLIGDISTALTAILGE